MAETTTYEQCTGCDRDDVQTWEEFFYFSPWDDEETSTSCHYCQHCDDTSPFDGTFYCEWCEREIAETNRNGHMYQYRIIHDCEQVCLRCIEERLKEKGIAGFEWEQEDLRRGLTLFAQFFNRGELEGEGWTADPNYHDRCIGSEDVAALGQRAWEHHEAGRMVIVEIERMSTMGDEGYFTLRTKEKSNA